MATLKVTQIGNSLGVILTKEVTTRMNVSKGDELSYLETPNGIEITPYDPDFDRKMRAARAAVRLAAPG